MRVWGILQKALRDRLVCGVRSEGIKRKLLTEENLSFDRAVQLATSMEIAEGQIKIMGTEPGTVGKLTVQKDDRHKKFNKGLPQDTSDQKYNNSTYNRDKTCKRCSRIHAENFNCPAINWKCYSCPQKGHVAKSILCKNKIQKLTAEGEEEKKTGTTEEDTLELGWIQEEGRLQLLSKSKGTESLRIKIPVEGKYLVMEVDSGACKLVIHISDYKEVFVSLEIEPVNF